MHALSGPNFNHTTLDVKLLDSPNIIILEKISDCVICIILYRCMSLRGLTQIHPVRGNATFIKQVVYFDTVLRENNNRHCILHENLIINVYLKYVAV